MKKLLFLSFSLLLTISCEKNPFPLPTVKNTDGETLPFENDNIKVTLVSTSGPANTRDMYFFNALKGIAINYYGEIYMTQDGGISWSLQYKNSINDQPFFQILFTDSNTGYVVGGSNSCGGTDCIPPGGIILKTIDGGTNWTKVYEMGKAEIVSICSNSSGDLFIAANGSKGRIARSNNGGSIWTFTDSTSFQLNRILFRDNFGFCTGMKGNILRTDNNGDSWISVATLDALYATDIKFIENNLVCMANNMVVYKSSDSGSSWTKIFTTDRIFYGINPQSENEYIIYGSGGYSGGCFGTFYSGIGHTVNAGLDWTIISFPAVPSILCSSFYSDSEGFLIGGFNEGQLLKVTLK